MILPALFVEEFDQGASEVHWNLIASGFAIGLGLGWGQGLAWGKRCGTGSTRRPLVPDSVLLVGGS